MKFSERIGKTPVRVAFQIESIDDKLSQRLWNITILYLDKLDREIRDDFCALIWTDFLLQDIDELPLNSIDILIFKEFKVLFKKIFSSMEWYVKYDLVEFLAELDSKNGTKIDFAKYFEEALKTEKAGYSIIKNKVTPVVNETEIQSIEEALNTSSSSIQVHLDTALAHLSNRKTPDYRNSIKESISAVESICKQIVGDDKDTLGKTLNKIDKSNKLPEALKSALHKLYGYTSDANGIRHSLTENEREPTMEEARFILITCSAFINYLKTFSSDF